jgi:PAS domain S-box-containing protein
MSTRSEIANAARPGSDWVVGGGETGKVVRSMDWSRTPLGPIGNWSSNLRTTVSLALNSNFPISLLWGPECTQIYNDGYRPLCGAKHPTALGQDFRECWASAFPVIGEAFRSARNGTAAFLEDQRMFIDRNGYLEETFFTFSFSPIRDESGAVAGLFHPVTETTSKMLAQRRTRALRDIAAAALTADSLRDGLQSAAETLSGSELDLPFVLFYQVATSGKTAELVAQYGLSADGPANQRTVELARPGAGWPIAEALATNTAIQVDHVRARLPGLVCAPYPEPIDTAFVLPITPPGYGGPACVMIAAASPRLPLTEAYRSFYEMAAAAMTTMIMSVTALSLQRKRAEGLAEIDRAKTAFFNNVSHEFRTPLTLLLGPIEEELADLSEATPPKRRDRLETAHRNSLRLLRLVNMLLDFARIEDGRTTAHYRLTDLGGLTSELAATFRSACERAGLQLTVDCPQLTEAVYVDHEMWEGIVLNLLSNALKYTTSGAIHVSVRVRAEAVELAVRDTGIGIPEAELSRVFERFYRVAGAAGRSHEGSGIGLAFVQQLVDQHGGSVRAQSQVGQGTTFTVSIPLGAEHLPADQIEDAGPAVDRSQASHSLIAEAVRWSAAQPLPEVEPASGPEVDGVDPRPRVLWADDNTDMREYVTRLLADDYQVEAVVDGQAALEAVRRSPPALVLTDVMMPRLDGLGLLRELRSDPETQAIPVILLSARAGEETRLDGLLAGADDYLVKPFTARELFARVGSHVQLATLRQETEAARSAVERAELLAASESQLRLITDALPVLIAYIDADLRYRFTNHAYEEWFDLPRTELSGRSVTSLWVSPDPAVMTNMAKALAGETVSFEWTMVQPSKLTRPCWSTYVPDLDSDGVVRGFFALTSDISEQRRAQAQIEQLNSDLERRVHQRTDELAASNAELRSANKELEAFSYSVSHDLRAPLRAIDGFARILSDEYLDHLPDEAHRYLGFVRKNAQKMGQLIDDLLTFARTAREPVARRVVNPTEIVQLCLQELAAEYADRDIRFSIAELPSCSADPALLKQVWLNLLSNAIKYTGQRATAEIVVGSESNQATISYFCRDNGAGFDMQHAKNIFGVFQRLHSADEYEGTGVGLAIVEQVVRRHGGRIWVESEVGHGTTFHFTLSRNEGPALDPAAC